MKSFKKKKKSTWIWSHNPRPKRKQTTIMSRPVDLHLSNVLVSLYPDNLQLHSFKGCDHCSVVRSLVLSTTHVRRFKWCRSPPSVHLFLQTVSCNARGTCCIYNLIICLVFYLLFFLFQCFVFCLVLCQGSI